MRMEVRTSHAALSRILITEATLKRGFLMPARALSHSAIPLMTCFAISGALLLLISASYPVTGVRRIINLEACRLYGKQKGLVRGSDKSFLRVKSYCNMTENSCSWALFFHSERSESQESMCGQVNFSAPLPAIIPMCPPFTFNSS